MSNNTFAYFIQTPDYIPDYVPLLEQNADVYILTFKSPVDHPNNIYHPSSWTEGRNTLAAIAQKRGYLYQIFMDDDVKLQVDPEREDPQKNPWRMFEDFLVEYKPAVGTVRYQPLNYYDEKAEVNTLYRFDAMFNAVHRDVMPLYFPQYAGFDNISWWWSQVITIHTMGIFCPNTVLQYNKLIMKNLRAGTYPRIIQFTLPAKIFRHSLREQKDKDKVVVDIIKNITSNGKYDKSKERNYKKMVEDAKRKVFTDNILWKDHPFFKSIL